MPLVGIEHENIYEINCIILESTVEFLNGALFSTASVVLVTLVISSPTMEENANIDLLISEYNESINTGCLKHNNVTRVRFVKSLNTHSFLVKLRRQCRYGRSNISSHLREFHIDLSINKKRYFFVGKTLHFFQLLQEYNWRMNIAWKALKSTSILVIKGVLTIKMNENYLSIKGRVMPLVCFTET